MSGGLGPEARALIHRALSEEPKVDAMELARVRRRVVAVAIGAGIVSATGKALASSGKLASVGGLGSIVGSALVGASGAVVAIGLSLSLTHEEATVRAGQTSVVPASDRVEAVPLVRRDANPGSVPQQNAPGELARPPSVRVEARPSEVPRAPASATEAVATGRAERAAQSSTDSILDELALLERVQRALRQGDAARALSLLDEHPGGARVGQLHAERLAVEVIAACESGQVERARAAARALRSYQADTPVSERVRVSCAEEPHSDDP